MLKEIMLKLKSHKGPAAAIGAAISVLAGGISSQVPEIRTIAFFLLLEIIVLAILVIISKAVYHLQTAMKNDPRLSTMWKRSVGNFVLGLHLAAGMVVLGVYFTV